MPLLPAIFIVCLSIKTVVTSCLSSLRNDILQAINPLRQRRIQDFRNRRYNRRATNLLDTIFLGSENLRSEIIRPSDNHFSHSGDKIIWYSRRSVRFKKT